MKITHKFFNRALNSIRFLSSTQNGSASKTILNEIAGFSEDKIPADMVVFTGNPANGDEIAEVIKKLIAQNHLENHKLLFLKFGAGMNPVVIDKSAEAADLKAGVKASIEHFRINSGQDCISPNFTLLPSEFRKESISIIKNEVRQLKYGELSDTNADYNSLTFGTQKSLNELQEFKEKYIDYLVTDRNALIDLPTKRVDPHVFIFPASKFQDFPLKEFYAPFSIFFTFDSSEELEKMVHDERLSKKAMFASVFGQTQADSFIQLKKHLKQTRHIVFQNASVFSEENGNRPFGGFGSDVSTVDFIEIKDGKMETKRFARPLLISKELRKGFANTLPTSMGVVTPKNSSVVETSTSESFGLEIEINVKHNPKMVLYYRPTKYSETEWIDMDYNKKIQAATQWELEIGKKYKVKGYEKLSTAPAELPLTLLSESNGFYEINGLIFKSVNELELYIYKVTAMIGEGYVQSHTVIDSSKFKGYAGYYKFMSEFSIIQRLALEQQRYHSSQNNPKFLPAANFVSHSLPPPSQSHYNYVDKVEKKISGGTFKGFETEEEYLLFKHVSAPVVRSSEGFKSTYKGNKIGIEDRMADWPADSTLMPGRNEEMLSHLKFTSATLDSKKDLTPFDEFKNLQSFGDKSIQEQISEFIKNYKKYFSQQELESLNNNNLSEVFGKNKLIDSLIRKQNDHIDYGPLDTSSRMLFPIKIWHLHPVFNHIGSEEKKNKIIQEYILSSKNYLLGVNELLNNLRNETNSAELLLKLRELLGRWSWGLNEKKYSEMLTPWNTELKFIKKGVEQEFYPKNRSCKKIFSISP